MEQLIASLIPPSAWSDASIAGWITIGICGVLLAVAAVTYVIFGCKWCRRYRAHIVAKPAPSPHTPTPPAAPDETRTEDATRTENTSYPNAND
jgi:hypothetical protein